MASGGAEAAGEQGAGSGGPDAAANEQAEGAGDAPEGDGSAAVEEGSGSGEAASSSDGVEPAESGSGDQGASAGGSEPVAMVSGSTGSTASDGGLCAGLQIAGMERKAKLTDSEVACLVAAAKGKVEASDADRQTAAVALYNAKTKGWAVAVEAALGQASLRNAPALNFAGIKPAYDAGRYSQVLQRADRVWRNFKSKGYQLSASDKTFVLEYACRSAFQLHQTGKSAEGGAVWCEGWLDRLERAGVNASEAQDIYDQLN